MMCGRMTSSAPYLSRGFPNGLDSEKNVATHVNDELYLLFYCSTFEINPWLIVVLVNEIGPGLIHMPSLSSTHIF